MNQRVMLTKQLLKKALTDLLQRQNIYQLSIRELCQQAGINRSTFYKYYGSQFDLLSEMEADLLSDIGAFLEDGGQHNTRILEGILHYLEGKIDFVRLLFNSNVDPEFPGRLFSFPPLRRMLQGMMDESLSEGEKEYALNFFLFGGFQVVRMWVNQKERENPEHLAAFLEEHLFIPAAKRR